jgi:DNA-binding transcriptional regulator GbsR (MarR family)
MARRHEYTDTVRDLKAVLRLEADDEKRRELNANLDKMAAQLERQRDQLTDVRVLTERVDGLVWVVRVVLIGTGLTIVAAIVVALFFKGHP